MARTADRWRRADQDNPALLRALPDRFVRNSVIKNADRDLASAARGRGSCIVDSLHQEVIAQRFEASSSRRLVGFAVPVLFPQVGDLPWEAIAELRRAPEITRLRRVTAEVEHEAAAECAGGDVEAAARHAYERHLEALSGTVDSMGTVVRKTAASVIIGGATGASTLPLPRMGIAGSADAPAGAARPRFSGGRNRWSPLRSLPADNHWRHPEHRGGRTSSNNGTAARCPCGRRIRVAESVLAVGPITCGLCYGEFTA